MFTIAEELLLLALDDDKGTVDYSSISSLEFGLAGAILAELTTEERLGLENKKVVVVDDKPVGDKVMDHVFDQIKDSPKTRTPKSWIQRLNEHEIKQNLLERLVEKGVLTEKEKKVLWVFTRHLYPTEQEAPEQQIRKRVEECLFENRTPDERTLILLSLLKACNLVGEVVLKKDKKMAAKRIEDLTEGNDYGKAVKASVEAMQAAVLAACIAATTAAAASTAANS